MRCAEGEGRFPGTETLVPASLVFLLLVAALPAAATPSTTAASPAWGLLPVPAGSLHAGDLVALGRVLSIDGEVSGSVVSVGGVVHIRGTVRKDVVVFGEDVVLQPGSRVEGDVLAVGGALRAEGGADPSSLVRGRRLTLAALEAAFLTELETSPLSGTALSPLLAAFRLLLLALWLVAGLLMLRLSPRRLDAAARSLRGSIGRAAALGAGSVVTGMLLSTLLLATVPAQAALAAMALVVVGLAVAKAFGLAALFVVVGRVAASRARRGSAFFGDPAALAIGLLALGTMSLVPGLGPFLWAGASLVGIGLSLATAFGSRGADAAV